MGILWTVPLSRLPIQVADPTTFRVLYFGAGQTEAKITLPLGKHTLRLLFADAAHVPHNPPVYSEAINVTVTESGRPPKKAPPSLAVLLIAMPR